MVSQKQLELSLNMTHQKWSISEARKLESLTVLSSFSYWRTSLGKEVDITYARDGPDEKRASHKI